MAAAVSTIASQPKWREHLPKAQQVIVPRGLHFPMADNPELVADTIATWHHERPVFIY